MGSVNVEKNKLFKFQLKDVVNYTDSPKWLDHEVSGALIGMTETFTSFEKPYMRVYMY